MLFTLCSLHNLHFDFWLSQTRSRLAPARHHQLYLENKLQEWTDNTSFGPEVNYCCVVPTWLNRDWLDAEERWENGELQRGIHQHSERAASRGLTRTAHSLRLCGLLGIWKSERHGLTACFLGGLRLGFFGGWGREERAVTWLWYLACKCSFASYRTFSKLPSIAIYSLMHEPWTPLTFVSACVRVTTPLCWRRISQLCNVKSQKHETCFFLFKPVGSVLHTRVVVLSVDLFLHCWKNSNKRH